MMILLLKEESENEKDGKSQKIIKNELCKWYFFPPFFPNANFN